MWALPQSEPALHGLGTTVAALLVDGAVGHVAHVGDSRVYCIRNGTIEVLTHDHSYLNDLAARGIELTDPAMRSRYESVLTRAIGVAPTVDVEIAHPPAPGRRHLSASAPTASIACSRPSSSRPSSPRAARISTAPATTIIARTNDGGGPDNCTIVLLRVDPDDASAP